MKKLVFILVAVIVAGCAVARQPRVVEAGFIDFRPYTDAGFLLSPDPYTGNFDALGEILVNVTPALVPAKSVAQGKFVDGAYNSVGMVREKIDAAELLELAYKQAIQYGADGIVDLKFTFQSDAAGISQYTISGLAIKRR